MKFIIALLILTLSATAEDYWKVEEIKPPPGVVLEVGGMCKDGEGGWMMCTRRGEVWNLNSGKWTLFASGLQEPLGIRKGNWPGEYFVLQRPELTRLMDENRDGKADLYSFFSRGWGFTGNYHSYAMAFTKDKDGNFYGGLGLPFGTKGKFDGKWLQTLDVQERGIFFKIDTEGNYSQYATGVREPVGSTFNDNGDLFVTDTQGSFIATNWVIHVEKGDFVGHPEGLLWDKSRPGLAEKLLKMPLAERNVEINKLRKRPVVYIPYRIMGASIGGLTFDSSKGKFGPYAGQLMVTDMISSLLNRVYMEKVQGVYQGAVFKLSSKVGGGAIRPRFAADGSLWIGKTARGWGRGLGLAKMTWSGKVPFDIKEMKLTKTGFKLNFTKPAASSLADKLKFESFYYEYTHGYTAKMKDKKPMKVTSVKLSSDGLSADVTLEGLKEDTVIKLDYKGLEAKDGTKTEFGQGWYTLNKLVK